MTVDDFINQTNGQHIDEDGYYGAQCWDLVARYARVVVGCPSFPTGSGGAEGLFRIFQDPIGQYFDRIANDANNPNQLPQKGDVIVWQASFSPPYGHTALVISADASGPTVLEQNGNNPGGVAYIKQRNWVGVSGWLRPKNGGNMPTIVNPNILEDLSVGLLDRGDSINDANLKNWINQPVEDALRGFIHYPEHQQLIARARNAVALGQQLSDANGKLLALQEQITQLGDRPTQEQLDALTKAVTDANAQAAAAQAELEKSQTQNQADTVAADTFLRRLGQFIKKYL